MIMSNLKINRFIVVAKGKNVYDESFHNGLNIIRGQNGSGKSTIMELIYFVLGADHIDWKEEALKCDFVLAEIEINQHILTLKREINNERRSHLYLFWGHIEEASTSLTWELYSMKRGSEKESFSQVMLRALNIPDSGENDNLTMHQILRVLYLDQLSPANLLMRPEQFDPQTMREAVSKTLMGAYNIQLLNDENKYKEMKRTLDQYKSEIESIQYILKHSESIMNIEELHNKINDDIERIKKIDLSLAENNQEKIRNEIKKIDLIPSDIFQKMKNEKEKFINLTDRYNSFAADIIDSESFIAELQQRTIDLDNSISIRNFLPNLTISYCPICLNPIEDNNEINICPLCKRNISENTLTTNILRLKNEIAFQIKESRNLLVEKQRQIEATKSEISAAKKQIGLLQTKIDSYSITVETTEQQERDNVLFLKGNLSKEIEYLNRELLLQEQLKEDIRIFENMKEGIAELELVIEKKRGELATNYNKAMNLIKNIASELIKNDFERDLPKDEASLSTLEIDFEKYNTFRLRGKNSFAASSMVYIKNSIMFAFLFASLELDSMNYPRFFMCDNIEDKGMEEERSHNFQTNIYDMSQKYKNVEHQIIITTSMIESTLDNSEICIGESYKNDSKSLKVEVQ
jgi:DNA repair exonuclease SbcCD ATPase subunit